MVAVAVWSTSGLPETDAVALRIADDGHPAEPWQLPGGHAASGVDALGAVHGDVEVIDGEVDDTPGG